jgi:hypothetical protein
VGCRHDLRGDPDWVDVPPPDLINEKVQSLTVATGRPDVTKQLLREGSVPDFGAGASDRLRETSTAGANVLPPGAQRVIHERERTVMIA